MTTKTIKTVLFASMIAALLIPFSTIQQADATHVYHAYLSLENFQVKQNSTSTSAIDISWDELTHQTKYPPAELKYYKVGIYLTEYPYLTGLTQNTNQTSLSVETNLNNTQFEIKGWAVFTDSVMAFPRIVNFTTASP